MCVCTAGEQANLRTNEREKTDGLLARKGGCDGREVGNHVVVNDAGLLGPDVVDEELDAAPGVLEEGALLVLAAEVRSVSLHRLRGRRRVGDGLVRLEIDGVGVKDGEEAQVEVDGDLLGHGDGLPARRSIRKSARRGEGAGEAVGTADVLALLLLLEDTGHVHPGSLWAVLVLPVRCKRGDPVRAPRRRCSRQVDTAALSFAPRAARAASVPR